MTLEQVIDACKQRGLIFEASKEITIESGATAKSLFVTGDLPAIILSREIGFGGDGVTVYAYRDPTVSALGDEDTTIRSPNDLKEKTATVKLYSSATITADGTETRKKVSLITSGNPTTAGQPIETVESEHRVPANKQICHTIVNREAATQTVYASLVWIEVPPTLQRYI